jgi:hypothetical protein
LETYISKERLFELVARILCDSIPPGSVDAVCFFGQTTENDTPMLESAARIQRAGLANLVAVTGFKGEKNEEKGFEVRSCEAFTAKLVELGVDPANIVGFPLSAKFPPCTDAEAIGVVEFAKERGWKSLIVTVPPLHQVRAFISIVSAAIKYYPELMIYSVPAEALPWTQEVIHSQSAPRARRSAQFAGELAKLEKYWLKGDHSSPDVILAYLDTREEGNPQQ